MGGKGGWTIAKPTAELGMRTVPSFSEPPLNRSSRAVSTGVPLFDFDLGSFVSEMRTTCILRKKDDRDSNIEIQPFPPLLYSLRRQTFLVILVPPPAGSLRASGRLCLTPALLLSP